MNCFLRVIVTLATILAAIINFLQNLLLSRKPPTYPGISNPILIKSVGELVLELRQKKIKSEDIVRAYTERIRIVNSALNAVIEDRFIEALKEAQHADQLIERCQNEQQILGLFARFPLLGIPFTVKESCGVKGMSFVVGSMSRRQVKCSENGDVVELLRSAGCIVLLVSANPEFCLSLDTNTLTHGSCSNPYDLRRSPAGSSGGEGALNGAGASLFGVGSDIAGSIRLPALYCGVFGHKPTGGLISVKGHFPYSSKDEDFANYLQLGPITRFARDLPILVQIMAGKNAEKLKFQDGIRTKDIKIHYAYGFPGLNGWLHPSVEFDIQLAITRAVKCFENGGLVTCKAQLKSFRNSEDVSLMAIAQLKHVPSILTQTAIHKPSEKTLIFEMIRSLIGHSLYTREAVFNELMSTVLASHFEKGAPQWRIQLEEIRAELLQLLGNDGVLFFPTYHTSALVKGMSILNLTSVDMLLLFNVLGFPATHIPMGLNNRGLPVGFQVIAAPYQDKLCLQIAAELENVFGGWTPPVPHEF